jgi:hypothetical protein
VLIYQHSSHYAALKQAKWSTEEEENDSAAKAVRFEARWSSEVPAWFGERTEGTRAPAAFISTPQAEA